MGRRDGRSRSWKLNPERSDLRGQRWGRGGSVGAPPPPSIPCRRRAAGPALLSATMEDGTVRTNPPAPQSPGRGGHPPHVQAERLPARHTSFSAGGSRCAPATAGHLPTGFGWESSAGLCHRGRWEGRKDWEPGGGRQSCSSGRRSPVNLSQ